MIKVKNGLHMINMKCFKAIKVKLTEEVINVKVLQRDESEKWFQVTNMKDFKVNNIKALQINQYGSLQRDQCESVSRSDQYGNAAK